MRGLGQALAVKSETREKGRRMATREAHSASGTATPGPGALAGIRVIELADEQAEYCGLTLAGLGAEVI